MSRFAPVAIATALWAGALAACAPKATVGPDPRVDAAVGYYIDGDYETAIEKLTELAGSLQSESDLQRVYLYLGRSFLAIGDPNGAVEAFSGGIAYGGESPFREYLDELGRVISATPEALERTSRVRRGQLAAALVRMFFADVDAPDFGGEIEMLVMRGVMVRTADGRTHADAAVTRAAFYAVVQRLGSVLGRPDAAAASFPGGYGWVLGDGDNRYVSGDDAMSVLARLASN